MYYEKAKIVKVSAIKEAIARGLFKKAGSPLEEILIRVCKGLLDSDDSSLKNKEFLKKCEQNQ